MLTDRAVAACARVATAISLWALTTTGCGPVLEVGGLSAKGPEWDPGQARCKVAASEENPLVTEWNASDKASLEASLKGGAVVVSYSGCELSVLSACRVPGSYSWQRTTPSVDAIEIRSADELYAKLPLGAVALEGELGRTGRLAVQTTVSGQLRLQSFDARSVADAGPCAVATHVVGAISIGAFEMRSGGTVAASGGATTALGSAEGATTAGESVVKTSGSAEQCKAASDVAPAAECASPIQVFLDPLPKTLARRAPTGRVRARFLPPDAEGPWELKLGEATLCTAPCETDIDPEVPHRLVHDPGWIKQNRVVEIPELGKFEGGDPILVRPQARATGEFVLGIVGAALGGLAAATGVVLISAGCGEGGGACAGGLITLPVGLLVAGGGAYMIIDSRPRVYVERDRGR